MPVAHPRIQSQGVSGVTDSGKQFRDSAFPNAQPLTETADWREVDLRDQHRIRCDRSHICGEQARWTMKSGPPFSYVCDHHRRVFEATGTFWKDGSL